MRLQIVFLSGLFLAGLGHLALGAQGHGSFRDGLKEILMREDDPTKVLAILEYSKMAGVPREQLTAEMESIILTSLDAVEKNPVAHVLCKLTTDAIGRIASTNALATVSKVAYCKDRHLRVAAIRAYVLLAGPESLGFASAVATNGEQFGPYERRLLYEYLACHAKHCEDVELEKRRVLVRRFLLEVVTKESEANAARGLDELLCSIIPSYKLSSQREQVAKRFQNSEAPLHRQYFGEVLSGMANLPLVDLSRERIP